MQKVTHVLAACLAFVVAFPGHAETIPALTTAEAIAIMPDGQMARKTITDAAKLDELMKVARPVPWCKMLLLGADGKVYLVNTDGHNPMVACEDMVSEAQ